MSKLAIKGGERVKTTPFPSFPIWDKEDEEHLLVALHSGRWSIGHEDSKNPNNKKFIEQLEQRMSDLQKAEYAIAMSNCTAALDVAVKSIDIQPGDEVIVTPYSFIASATCILQAGAVPVFADINEKTWNIDPDCIRKSITSKAKAIVVVHFGGQSADMDEIRAIANEHGLRIIEDCAHAFGASWRNAPVGTIGDVGCFSFQQSKNVTCGEGGVLVTNDVEIFKKAYSYHMSGRKYGGQWYQHEVLGWNYKITEFQAALACSQMNKAEKLDSIRSKNALRIIEALDKIDGLDFVKTDERVTERVYHLLTFTYDPKCFGDISKKRFLRALYAEGIPLLDGYKYPIYKNGLFINDKKHDYSIYEERCPVVEKKCEQGVWIPQTLLLGSEKDISELIDAFYKVIENIDELRR